MYCNLFVCRVLVVVVVVVVVVAIFEVVVVVVIQLGSILRHGRGWNRYRELRAAIVSVYCAGVVFNVLTTDDATTKLVCWFFSS